MRKQLFLATLFMLCFLGTSYAQNDTKWAVGPDLYGLINKNVLPKYTLFVRYKLGNKGAVRLRGGFNIYDVDRQYLLYDFNEEKVYTFRVGYERVKAIHKQSLLLHYGAEYVYFFDSILRYEQNSPLPIKAITAVRYSENGGAAFIGCRYFLIPALSISFESSFQLTNSFVSRLTPGLISLAPKPSTNTFNLFPVNSLNVCFHF